MSSCAIRRIAYVLHIFFKCCYILCRLGAEDPQLFRVVSRFAESPMLVSGKCILWRGCARSRGCAINIVCM